MIDWKHISKSLSCKALKKDMEMFCVFLHCKDNDYFEYEQYLLVKIYDIAFILRVTTATLCHILDARHGSCWLKGNVYLHLDRSRGDRVAPCGWRHRPPDETCIWRQAWGERAPAHGSAPQRKDAAGI